MNRFVRNFGGELVSNLVGTRSPPFANADYWFEQDNVVAELKCLAEDDSREARIRKNVQKLFDSFHRSGRMPYPKFWGVRRINSTDCPPAFQRALYRLLAQPLKGRLRKANQQIRETRKHLGKDDAYGLVLLANDGHYHLEPAQFRHAVDVALGKDFSAIEGLILFTVNLLSTGPGVEPHASHINVWMPCSRVGHREISDEFLRRFQEGWTQHVGNFIGEKIPVIYEMDTEIEGFRYDQRLSRTRR
jgi:hypothetical protein